MMDFDFAQRFAHDWIGAWNSRDIERIFQFYTDDFEINSPLVIQRMNEPSGRLRGKAAIRPYWQIGLSADPPIYFELDSVLLGVDTLSIVYRRQGGRLVVEVFSFDASRLISSVIAHYGR